MITEAKCVGLIRGELTYYCEWKGKNDQVYNIIIKIIPDTKELVYHTCTCPYGSFYGKSKKNINGKDLCRHEVHSYSEIIKANYETTRQILIDQGVMDKDHLKKP